jgi:hypothetical protein
MDFIKLDSTTFGNGQIINDIKSAKWVERYQEPGDFEFRCNPYDSIRTQLSLGSLISHLDTREVMMVEDHEINESLDGDPELVITGRSLFAFLENRMATPNNFPKTNPVTDKDYLYEFTSRKPEDQIVQLLQEHISPTTAIFSQDGIPNATVTSSISSTDAASEIVVGRGQLYSEVQKLIAEIDAGIKIMRPSPGTVGSLTFLLHQGVDKSDSVIFSSQFGDLESTRYFWSNRNYRNSTLVMGKYTYKVNRYPSVTGLDMRVVITDATNYDAKPDSSEELAATDRILDKRARWNLAKYKKQRLVETSIVANTRYNFRKDYDIGDIVFISGNYGISEKMRVVEYAEFEDESGETGVPTVKALD